MHSKEDSWTTTIRRTLVAVVALTVVTVGVPLFYTTTTIHRAELPVDHINGYAHSINTVSFEVPVYLDVPNAQEFFIDKAQGVVNTKLQSVRDVFSIKLIRGKGSPNDYTVRFVRSSDDAYNFEVSPFKKESTLYIGNDGWDTENFIAAVLVEQVFKEEVVEFSRLSHRTSGKDIAVRYSPRYNLVLSLLVENGHPVEWEIDSAVALLQPVLDKLAHFANFTVSTQIQYYLSLVNEPTYDNEKRQYVIPQYDLSTFINHGDWNLITHDIDPSINFVVFFAASNFAGKPLVVDQSSTNSFVVPQWGGVSIFNKDKPVLEGSRVVLTEGELVPVLETFTSQLFELLGVPRGPKNPDVRIDGLTRLTTAKNLQRAVASLVSLVKVTDSLSEISIPEKTKAYVQLALRYVAESLDAIGEHRFNDAMTLSARAVQNSDNAFFEKEMVQQAYFPSEHKLAVFLPLLGPVGGILTISILKLVKELKRKEEKEPESESQEAENRSLSHEGPLH